MSSKKSNSVCILTRKRIEDIAKDKVSKLPHSYFRGMVYIHDFSTENQI